jgi:hypothetical protein
MMDYSLEIYSTKERRWMLVISASLASNPQTAENVKRRVDEAADEWSDAGYKVRVGGIERTDAATPMCSEPMLLAA